jgi:hypothetical protein
VSDATIHPAILPIVRRLRANGYVTTDSGDGVTNVEAGMEGALPFPHVVCRVAPTNLVSEANRLHALFPEWDVQANYSPNDGVATLLVAPEGMGP